MWERSEYAFDKSYITNVDFDSMSYPQPTDRSGEYTVTVRLKKQNEMQTIVFRTYPKGIYCIGYSLYDICEDVTEPPRRGQSIWDSTGCQNNAMLKSC